VSPANPSVVIVDDHHLFRAGVRAELDGLVAVLGDAATVEEAVRLVLAAEPDVVLLDVQMPDGGGAEVIRGVAPRRPGAPARQPAHCANANPARWLPRHPGG